MVSHYHISVYNLAAEKYILYMYEIISEKKVLYISLSFPLHPMFLGINMYISNFIINTQLCFLIIWKLHVLPLSLEYIYLVVHLCVRQEILGKQCFPAKCANLSSLISTNSHPYLQWTILVVRWHLILVLYILLSEITVLYCSIYECICTITGGEFKVLPFTLLCYIFLTRVTPSNSTYLVRKKKETLHAANKNFC